jgi:hypothetical protein
LTRYKYNHAKQIWQGSSLCFITTMRQPNTFLENVCSECDQWYRWHLIVSTSQSANSIHQSLWRMITKWSSVFWCEHPYCVELYGYAGTLRFLTKDKRKPIKGCLPRSDDGAVNRQGIRTWLCWFDFGVVPRVNRLYLMHIFAANNATIG